MNNLTENQLEVNCFKISIILNSPVFIIQNMYAKYDKEHYKF